ncbi:MAG: OmpH family outer membrane protein [Acetobacteraceae bacterium]|jgi:Skp family chaperone for outer membrane proteins
MVTALLSLPLCALAQPVASPTPPPAAGQAGTEPPPLTLEQILARLPPPPPLPPMVSGAAPPAIVTGVLSIPDVMRIAVAAQEVDKVLGARRQKLTDDEQKEQQSLHDLDQQLANDRPKLSAEQVRVRERELQDRLNDSRRRFATRDRIIQDAGQFCLVQIQREMTAVVQLVAAERNMNFIVRREQVVLSTGDVDITAQVLDILNKVLPSVIIPPDGVAVLDLKPVAGSKPADAGQPKH